MLIGAHVSAAGGPAEAASRAAEIGCDAMQIFSQNPRNWRTKELSDTQLAEYRAAIEEHGIRATVVHAVYLINCASPDDEIRGKSTAALGDALRNDERLGSVGTVLHPGSSRGEEPASATERIADAVHESMALSERSRLLLENTAGAGFTIGRTLEEIAELIEAIGRRSPADASRTGVCLDSCHLLASGFDVRTPRGVANLLDRFDDLIGLDRLECLHLNDSKGGLGSNRDRHANLGEGELGEEGLRAFLGEPRLQEVPVILEVPGPERKGPDARQVEMARRLHAEALRHRQGVREGPSGASGEPSGRRTRRKSAAR